MATPESESFVRAFVRGLQIINVMGQGDHRQTLAEIAAATQLPRTAVRRFLFTLIRLAFVRTDGKHYWLTPRVLGLGLSYLSSLPYWREAQPTLEELSARVRQSCALSVLDGADIVYVQRQHTKRILPMSPSLGSRLPAHLVSMGRVLLAGLPDAEITHYLETTTFKRHTSATVTEPERLHAEILKARAQGYAWVDGELDESICGLAVPVRNRQGETIAAINVSLTSGEFNCEDAASLFLPGLRLAAARLRAASD